MSSKHREARAENESTVDEGLQAQKPAASAETAAAPEVGNPSVADGAAAKADEAAAKAEAERAARETVREAELAALRAELSEVNDKYLRKLADDANYRKRMVREKEEGQRYAVASLLGDLVPILDDFDRAIASAETSQSYAVLHDGIQLIRRQMGQMLENKYGLVQLGALGQPFDPNRHEAVAMAQAEPGEGGAETVVTEVFLPGYGLHDRILRSAKVRVRMPAPGGGGGQEPGADASEAK